MVRSSRFWRNPHRCVPLATLARVKTSNLHIDYKPVASLPGVWVNIASLPCLEYAHYHPIFRLLSGHLRTISRWFSIIGGNTRTPLLTPRWPRRCLSRWENTNLSGVPPECSAYCSSAVSPDTVPLFRLPCPKAGRRSLRELRCGHLAIRICHERMPTLKLTSPHSLPSALFRNSNGRVLP